MPVDIENLRPKKMSKKEIQKMILEVLDPLIDEIAQTSKIITELKNEIARLKAGR